MRFLSSFDYFYMTNTCTARVEEHFTFFLFIPFYEKVFSYIKPLKKKKYDGSEKEERVLTFNRSTVAEALRIRALCLSYCKLSSSVCSLHIFYLHFRVLILFSLYLIFISNFMTLLCTNLVILVVYFAFWLLVVNGFLGFVLFY